jgi:hypothetical protein
MYVRFDVGTDVATLGAWDASRGAQVATAAERKSWSETLEADVEAGRVFLISTGGDGGGALDVYIDEPIPSTVSEALTRVDGEFLLALPSGELIVDGAEFYRTSTAAPKASKPANVRPGDYVVRCYEQKDDEVHPKTEEELERVVGRADISYYDRMNHVGCWLGLTMVLFFPVWWYVFGFLVAFPLTIITFLSSFHVHRWIKKRDARYQRLLEVIPTYRVQLVEPSFVLELRYITDRAGLRGGSVTAD